MNNKQIGLIVGGLLPAFLYGLSAIFSKASAKYQLGAGHYMVVVGTVQALAGAMYILYRSDDALNTMGAFYAALQGVAFAVATALVFVALKDFSADISVLTPLYNMNTLVAVLLGLVIFSEYQSLNLIKLLIGAVLTVLGGIMVSMA